MMEDMIVGDEFYQEQIDEMIANKQGYSHTFGVKETIGEAIQIMYSNDNPEWVFTFLLVGVSAGRKLNLYRLIYKYTG